MFPKIFPKPKYSTGEKEHFTKLGKFLIQLVPENFPQNFPQKFDFLICINYLQAKYAWWVGMGKEYAYTPPISLYLYVYVSLSLFSLVSVISFH